MPGLRETVAADGHGYRALLKPATGDLVAYPCIAGCYQTMRPSTVPGHERDGEEEGQEHHLSHVRIGPGKNSSGVITHETYTADQRAPLLWPAWCVVVSGYPRASRRLILGDGNSLACFDAGSVPEARRGRRRQHNDRRCVRDIVAAPVTRVPRGLLLSHDLQLDDPPLHAGKQALALAERPLRRCCRGRRRRDFVKV